MAGEQYEIYESGTAAALAEWQLAALAEKPDSTALSPLLTAGAALGITGEATDSAAWLQRVSTSDGPTTVRSIHGRTVRWNQLVSDSATSVTVPSGHKYVARIDGTATLATSSGAAITVTGGTDNIFDLTTMFGAGSEPSTIAEFEALYPLPYYAYDAGSLLPVNMTGIEAVGFNRWDEVWESGDINASGVPTADASRFRSKNFIPVFPATAYYFNYANSNSRLFYYDENKEFISAPAISSNPRTFTTPANCRYLKFFCVGTTYNHDICINLSDPTRNGTYVPHWQQTRTIPAGTLRGAGSVYDKLTATERITRIGAVDLGTLTWTKSANWGSNGPAFYTTDLASLIVHADDAVIANAECVKAPTVSRNYLYAHANDGVAINTSGAVNFRIAALADGDAAAFKAAMDGVYLFYELATPTTTPNDPPLNITYRTEQGGIERVMVPTGENSAPPTIVAASGYTAESLRDTALSAIAPVENGLASDNYGVGSYLIHGGQLCRVTTAIATGEAISIGTNVTATTVMAEVIALIAQ